MPRRTRSLPSPVAIGIIILILLLLLGGTIARTIIDYQWWNELGQLSTWFSILLYGTLPAVVSVIVIFAVFWVAHARGMKRAGTGLSRHPRYARVATLVILVASIILGSGGLDTWTTVRYFGARTLTGAAAGWHDPVFGHPLTFYFFELPFYTDLLGLFLIILFLTTAIYWVTDLAWTLHQEVQGREDSEAGINFDVRITGVTLARAFESRLLRGLIALFSLALALRVLLSRYSLLLNEHGFLVGMDYVDEHIALPLRYLTCVGFVLAAVFVLIGRPKWAAVAIVPLALQVIVPGLVNSTYVKPNELTLQRPYIQRHIEATRAAFGLNQNLVEQQFPARLEGRIDPSKHTALLENVRLWDWRAFHDTITQLQALRQYYVFNDTDIDRYTIDGKLHQVLLTPRELDVRQLPGASANWINTHFIYTHGYGAVMAEANKITPSGTPVLYIQDAPPRVATPSLKLTRPEIYYGEVADNPVFVRTGQPEFNYPSGSDNVHSRYDGKGGFPITPFFTKLAAAIANGDSNILLTNQFTDDSRMMIRRDIRTRLSRVADFLEWDSDPYLVITEQGRLVWMVDGYTTSHLHPYSREIEIGDTGRMNYIRNSVKATVDAYDGSVNLYIFDPQDPIIRAYQAIFPALFHAESEMPADLRAHARYPEFLFSAQANTYRMYHMRDPESFYNREDLWDLAKRSGGQNAQADFVRPTYVIASLPGSDAPEFMLMEPFTPRSKDNLIGLMLARCDGPNLGQMEVLQLSKQSLIYGPLQIDARIDSDQNISKDLSLWNQQGSSVIRGQMIILPIEDTFLYVEPIYIQSSQARMPQLKKVVVAMGNTVIYRDTYEQAIAELGVQLPPVPDQGFAPGTQTTTAAPAGTKQAATPSVAPTGSDPRVTEIRSHMQRYRELSAQGKWADAGKELEAIERLVK